jgi:primosomal protein N' (replication factor Y)
VARDKQHNLFQPEDFPDPPTAWETADLTDVVCAEVVFNIPVDQTFLYRVPDELRGHVQAGQRVKAPFGRGNQVQVGYCVGLAKPPETWGPERFAKIKFLTELVDVTPLLSGPMLQLTRWIGEHYLCAWGQVLESVIPAGVKNQAGTRMVTLLRLSDAAKAQRATLVLTAKQTAVVDCLMLAKTPIPMDEVTKTAKCGTVPVNALRSQGIIESVKQRAGSFSLPEYAGEVQADLKLNKDQQLALDKIHTSLRSGLHKTLLLYGVTGSGKTEVYIQAIREVVSYGRQAIVLVPEISLTPQTIRRFQCRFPSVAVLHSHLGDSERHWHWQQIAQGHVQVIVGARSAIFAPCRHLGLIIIDEEHESTFKQDSTPRYHTRDVARKRAELEKIPLILGSATPTLESWKRAILNEDELVSMPRRVEGLPMPPVVVVDVRNDPELNAGASLGRALRNAMHQALAAGGQVILFLNLRGYSPVLWCRACGAGIKCPNCDISLSWHKDKSEAICHSCDYRTTAITHCPHCGHAGVRYLGTGTQRLEQEVKARFGNFPCLRMDSDSMQSPGSHDRALERFRSGEIKILLGTQMIAKGLDFPNVTLVGVIDADTVLHQPEFRASERTFQLIAQVAGRTGRSIKGGRVLVQSSSPGELPIQMAAQHNYLGFATRELLVRREMNYPPYQFLTRVILRGPHEFTVQETAKAMADLLRKVADETKSEVRILGPAPAPVTKLKNLFRYHFQLSAPTLEPIQILWRAVRGDLPQGKDVEYVVDVDPLNLR